MNQTTKEMLEVLMMFSYIMGHPDILEDILGEVATILINMEVVISSAV